MSDIEITTGKFKVVWVFNKEESLIDAGGTIIDNKLGLHLRSKIFALYNITHLKTGRSITDIIGYKSAVKLAKKLIKKLPPEFFESDGTDVQKYQKKVYEIVQKFYRELA